MANEFVAKNGLISQNNTTVTGSLIHGLAGNIATGEYSHAEGSITKAIGNYSHAEGQQTQAYGDHSHTEGRDTIASGSWSHAEGQNTIASGSYSHAEGGSAKAIGEWSHAEGDFTQAKGEYSHAEGNRTIASGSHSHAEGYLTIASGDYSHAEGQNTMTLVSAQYSHAEGNNTIAAANWQHVQGQWNATSSIPAAFIVGNGTDDLNRSNLIYAHDSTVEITGSFIVTGSATVTGSITTTDNINGATPTEIGYLSGSTSNLQTQLNGRLTNDATVLGYQGLGSSIKGYPLGINLTAVGASTQFTNQRLWLIPVYVPADSMITGVRWLQIASGSYTANNYNGVALYTVAGGTINIAVSSSNNGNIWKTFFANTWGSQSFDTPYSASKGSYFIGAVLNATTIPSPVPSVGNVSIAAATVQSFDFTGGRLYNILATQLTMPTSVALSTTTGVNTGWYFALY